jgi:hypothetical protein
MYLKELNEGREEMMRCTFKVFAAGFILAAGCAGSVAAGPLEDGLAACDRGDYASARADCGSAEACPRMEA